MLNQNECDHVVAANLRDLFLVHQEQDADYIKENSDSLSFQPFEYCPDCGAKIDWDKVKEELDAESR